MVIKKDKLHLICWVCWSSKDFRIRVENKLEVFLTCNNCSTLTEIYEECE